MPKDRSPQDPPNLGLRCRSAEDRAGESVDLRERHLVSWEGRGALSADGRQWRLWRAAVEPVPSHPRTSTILGVELLEEILGACFHGTR